MGGAAVLVVVLQFLCLAVPSSSLFFNVQEGGPVCFVAEIPESTLVLARYRHLDFGKVPHAPPLAITVKEPSNAVLTQHTVTDESGQVRRLCVVDHILLASLSLLASDPTPPFLFFFYYHYFFSLPLQ